MNMRNGNARTLHERRTCSELGRNLSSGIKRHRYKLFGAGCVLFGLCSAGILVTPKFAEPKIETIVERVMVQTPCIKKCTLSEGDFVFKIDRSDRKNPSIFGLKVARVDANGVEFSPYFEIPGSTVTTGDKISYRWRVVFGETRKLDERAYNLTIKAEKGPGRKAKLEVEGLNFLQK